jgi:hypothetical protein
MRVVFDTNVVLDVLLERKPYLQDAATLFAAVPRMRTASSRATRKTSSEAGCASTPPQSLSPSFERFINSLWTRIVMVYEPDPGEWLNWRQRGRLDHGH